MPPPTAVADILSSLHHLPLLRRARIDMRRGKTPPARLLIGIGQMHPVSRGRFERFQAGKIAKIQTWIFRCCSLLRHTWDIRTFGQEGLSLPGGGRELARLDPQFLADAKRDIGADPDGYLRRAARQWRVAVHRNRQDDIGITSLRLNGLTVLQALDSGVAIFPIEQRDVHGAVGAAVAQLQAHASAIESSAAFQSAVAKQGRRLSQQELQVVQLRNAVAKEFRRMLSHPERDRAIFRNVLEHARRTPVTVFILGQGHRPGMLRLAREFLPDDMAFLWITPPSLWWWRAMTRRTLWLLAAMIIAAGVWTTFF